ncbi:MAG: hypothetical protein KAS82_06440 [Bacteroidales bacterium]|nr:hypothetical protein [Bacteroidales bacterium]
MKKRSLTVVVLVIVGLILTVIVVDILNNRPDRRGGNPYALKVDRYREVDPELISHKEIRNFSLGLLIATDMSYYNQALYISGNSTMAVISLDGSESTLMEIPPRATCLEVDEQHIFIGFGTYVAKFNHAGELLQQWADLGDRTVITNLAIKEDKIFIADAGNRRIVIFNREGEQLGMFEGKAESDAGHGFIVPSANFDLAVNSFGELWVVNPGKHAMENYTDDGRLRGFWENLSFEIEGFLGCCNPSRITTMTDGSFVTSEKGLVRIKIYDQSGKLMSVVAPNDLFNGEKGTAPEVCVDENDVIYVLDFENDMVRVFEPKEKEE